MKTPPDPLDSLLDKWSQTPAPPQNLKTEIWRRIAVEEGRQDDSGVLSFLNTLFGQRAFAGLFVAACVLLGLFLAEFRLTKIHADRSTQLAKNYLQLIDPLLIEPAPPTALFRP
jgi:hypothetical protein